MSLSWNEIRSRTITFKNEWKDVNKENAETQTFYNEFFNIFGISRKRVASFEAPVKKLNGKNGRIDLFWKGILLVEQKSKGRDLEKAYTQALDYFPNLTEDELPKYILVCDFENFELYDLVNDREFKFKLTELDKYIQHFGFIAGHIEKNYKDLEEVNIKASEKIGKLYDELVKSNYTGQDLEILLVRIVFCLFADDAGIFEKDIFIAMLEEKTKEDGSDTGLYLIQLFQLLNTSPEKRQNTLDSDLKAFPYINGGLFTQTISIPTFTQKMRDTLKECCYFDWSQISPAIFGSLFQSVADQNKRRALGEHYTSEKNILKTIHPLFLDELNSEFEKAKNNKSKLKDLWGKISKIKVLDPACGCGNFLIISYREIRRIENQIIEKIYNIKDYPDLFQLSRIDVDNFYGIEIEEFPVKIAETALWLTDHLLNMELSNIVGKNFIRIPLRKKPNIVHANALTTDWKTIIDLNNLSYIIGNPPFVGSKMQTKEQKEDLLKVFHDVKNAGNLDFVACWYKKASEYIQGTKIQCAFVSTNSITQGEQVDILWNNLINNLRISINFAHRTFAWNNEAGNVAKVHCVIIGFANFNIENKRLFDYADIKGEPTELKAKNINPYLVDGKNVIISSRNKPICDVPEIIFGNMANDGGNLILSKEEKEEFIKQEPQIEKYIRKFIGAEEFINNKERYCLWLKDANPMDIRNSTLILERIKKVKEHRMSSTREATIKLANFPSLFGEIRQPNCDYILIPRVSSEKRKYIPIGFIDKNTISSDSCLIIPTNSLYLFGVLTSLIHMTWVKYVCGRLKMDYRYSANVVYNNFPFPQNITDKQKRKIEEKAQKIIDIREKFQDCSLADLYDPNTMPSELIKAHEELDKAVDGLYRKEAFKDEKERVEFLFGEYERIIKFINNKL